MLCDMGFLVASNTTMIRDVQNVLTEDGVLPAEKDTSGIAQNLALTLDQVEYIGNAMANQKKVDPQLPKPHTYY